MQEIPEPTRGDNRAIRALCKAMQHGPEFERQRGMLDAVLAGEANFRGRGEYLHRLINPNYTFACRTNPTGPNHCCRSRKEPSTLCATRQLLLQSPAWPCCIWVWKPAARGYLPLAQGFNSNNISSTALWSSIWRGQPLPWQ
jgi:hypothetical protein